MISFYASHVAVTREDWGDLVVSHMDAGLGNDKIRIPAMRESPALW